MKHLNALYEKYSVLIKLICMVVPLIFATYKYLMVYIDVPDRMTRFEQRAKADSVMIMKRFHAMDSIEKTHTIFLQADFDTLISINERLKNR